MKRVLLAAALVAAMVWATPSAKASSPCYADPVGDANPVGTAWGIARAHAPIGAPTVPVNDSRSDLAGVCVDHTATTITVRFLVPGDSADPSDRTGRRFQAYLRDAVTCDEFYFNYSWGSTDSGFVVVNSPRDCDATTEPNVPSARIPGVTGGHGPGSGQFSLSMPIAAAAEVINRLSGHTFEAGFDERFVSAITYVTLGSAVLGPYWTDAVYP